MNIHVEAVATENMNNVSDETLLPYQEIRYNRASNLIAVRPSVCLSV